MTVKQPSYFIAHGSPMWLGDPDQRGPKFLGKLGSKILKSENRPTSVIIISAHWETSPELRITTNEKHTLLFDYYGFPKEWYDINYPAVGEPAVAHQAKALLEMAGFKVAEEKKRGLDHGAFTPVLYMFPKQELPIVQLSLPETNKPESYYNLGRALAPLRSQGVLILGAGFIVHNLSVMRRQFAKGLDAPVEPWAESFTKTVEDAVLLNTGEQRKQALLATFEHKDYAMSSPTPEHYAPVLVAAGAAHDDDEEGKAELVHSGWELGVFTEDSFRFGADV
ncbi:hypothetical protein HDU76_003282 [Blyttiomyces sp. JEL0837]|nr:hypothetical protein HDU76_003282 [Blyttiomyces sp. JEL0837]